MSPIKIIKSWHSESCPSSNCQPIHLSTSPPPPPSPAPSSSPPYNTAERANIRCIASPPSFSSLCHDHPVLLFLLGHLKETWSLKSAKCSTPEHLKGSQLNLLSHRQLQKEESRRLGPAGGRQELKRERRRTPSPNKGRDNCFVLLGALPHRRGSRKWRATHGF